MAELNIDRMLEEKEKKERAAKKNATVRMIVFVSAGVIAAGCIAGILAIMLQGDQGETYFPLEPGVKCTYNRTGLAPEEWTVMDKTEAVSGYECSVLNITDKGTYMSRQEYYCVDEEQGIARLAYSENYGPKVNEVFKLMPYKLKPGAEFSAADIKGETVKAVIREKEPVTTPVGEYEAYRIDYKAPGKFDVSIWYAKGVGIVKQKDNLSGVETGIISMVK